MGGISLQTCLKEESLRAAFCDWTASSFAVFRVTLMASFQVFCFSMHLRCIHASIFLVWYIYIFVGDCGGWVGFVWSLSLYCEFLWVSLKRAVSALLNCTLVQNYYPSLTSCFFKY